MKPTQRFGLSISVDTPYSQVLEFGQNAESKRPSAEKIRKQRIFVCCACGRRLTEVSLLYSDAFANLDRISGAIIELRYDTDKIDSYDDATVRVHTPDEQDLETTFDLGHLH
jgi:hypothetical protein